MKMIESRATGVSNMHWHGQLTIQSNSKVNLRIREHDLRESGREELMINFLDLVAASEPDKLSLVWIEL